jgi:hypothetical protein
MRTAARLYFDYCGITDTIEDVSFLIRGRMVSSHTVFNYLRRKGNSTMQAFEEVSRNDFLPSPDVILHQHDRSGSEQQSDSMSGSSDLFNLGFTSAEISPPAEWPIDALEGYDSEPYRLPFPT